MRKIIVVLFIISLSTQVFASSRTAMDKAWASYLKGDYNSAIDSCRIVSKNVKLGAEGRYLMGICFLKLNDTKEARKNFEFALENYPKSPRIEEIMLGVADSYYIDKDHQKAEAAYQKMLRKFPNSDYASMAYLRLGECQRELGKWRESETSFCKIMNTYALSLEAQQAQELLKKQTSYFSIQVGAFSKRDNADSLAVLLNQKGHNAYVDKVYSGDNLIYRVRVGQYNTKEQAEAQARSLAQEGFSTRICSSC